MFSATNAVLKLQIRTVWDALGLVAQEITAKTQSRDFACNCQIHNCWLIPPGEEEITEIMSLINMAGAWLAFSDASLLENAEMAIEENERVHAGPDATRREIHLMRVLTKRAAAG